MVCPHFIFESIFCKFLLLEPQSVDDVLQSPFHDFDQGFFHRRSCLSFISKMLSLLNCSCTRFLLPLILTFLLLVETSLFHAKRLKSLRSYSVPRYLYSYTTTGQCLLIKSTVSCSARCCSSATWGSDDASPRVTQPWTMVGNSIATSDSEMFRA